MYLCTGATKATTASPLTDHIARSGSNSKPRKFSNNVLNNRRMRAYIYKGYPNQIVAKLGIKLLRIENHPKLVYEQPDIQPYQHN